MVPAPSDGERLDRFLAGAQTDLSRSRLQSLIRGGRVSVNGRPARASLRLRPGDAVEVEPLPEVASGALEPEALPLVVVFEDEHLLVLDKPAGLVVHPGAGVRSGTLVHGLLHRWPAIRTVGGPDRPGVVHRLDKDTSGLLVVAKTSRAHRDLVEQMRRRAVSRIYAALVWGDMRGISGRIEAAIGRDPRQRKRMAVVDRGGRAAVTHWRVRERFGVATLLDVRLETGRTHQIRVHLAHAGHPVVGDATYGGRPRKQLSGSERERSLAADLLQCLRRQALHATELALTHPVQGEECRFTSSIPEDFASALARLRRDVRDREA
jgi:23S rRNA pseudouridine1911/1915/1917 synthase